MPAPNNMLGRQSLPISISPSNRNTTDSGSHQGAANNNAYQSGTSAGAAVQRTVSDPTGTVSVANPRSFDEIFVSKPVSEVKTMLWEIKDFNTVVSNRVERAMNFEFEMGRLGSMERHLPRRSRWKVMFDVEEMGSLRIPAIRVLQLSPDNKNIFYQLDACILEKANGVGTHPDKETDFRTPNFGYKEGLNDSRSDDNVFPIQSNSSCSDDNFLDQIRNYIYEGSLFLKVKMEILEDAST